MTPKHLLVISQHPEMFYRQLSKLSRLEKREIKMKCCVKTCGKDIDIQKESRIEVKTVLPSRFSGEKFQVSWSEDGEAKSHSECWQRLLQMKTSVNRKVGTKRRQPDSSNSVTKEEKALIREAKKTAEYFDSLEQIKHEASRVAGMLKSAKHCVAFTGL
jgi:mono-ADP-ribosyltransferase sirtuin 6